ncbi:hypothetical protein M8S88_13425, partial [Enterobacter hormaechei]|nr:hypothetical protein [Enterobacter hormaechei]
MIYDCFLYYDEDMLLDIRLHTLADVVDRFVIVEATHSFTGIPRELHFGNDSNLLIVFYVQIVPDDFVMQLHR